MTIHQYDPICISQMIFRPQVQSFLCLLPKSSIVEMLEDELLVSME